MKITLIHGQIHQGSTYHVSRMLAEKLGGEITEFFLPRDFGEPCVGCAQCISADEKRCPHHAKLAPLTQAVDDADVLILDSPVYVYHVSSGMKAFLEHYGWRWILHRPEDKMFRKQVVCVATSYGGGHKNTCQDMADSASWWGCGKIYKYGLAVRAHFWKDVSEKTRGRIDRDTTALAEKIKSMDGAVRPSLKVRIFFPVMGMILKKQPDSVEAKYWQQKGWFSGAKPWKA